MSLTKAEHPSLRLLRDGLFTDFVIETPEARFKVHKGFMFSQSGYFRSLLAGTNKESREGKVQFEDIPVYLLARVVLPCYDTDSYPLTISKSLFALHEDPAVSWDDTYSQAVSNNFVAAELAVKMHQLGDRFDIPHLRRLARISFLRAWHNHHGLTPPGLNAKQAHFSSSKFAAPDTLCSVIRQAYTTTPAEAYGLRDIIIRSLNYRIHIGNHFQENFLCLNDLLQEQPEVAFDLAVYQVTEARFQCIHCGHLNRQIKRPCVCEKRAVDCTADACVQRRLAASFCVKCCNIEALRELDDG